MNKFFAKKQIFLKAANEYFIYGAEGLFKRALASDDELNRTLKTFVSGKLQTERFSKTCHIAEIFPPFSWASLLEQNYILFCGV